MKFFGSSELSRKLTFPVIVPLCGILFLSIVGILERRQTAVEMAEFHALSAFANHAGALIHECQRERGRSTGFLDNKGEKFGADLVTQRHATDAQAAELNIFLRESHLTGTVAFKNNLQRAETNWHQLENKRQSISSLELKSSECVQYYSEVIDAYIDAIGEIPKHGSNADVSTQFQAFLTILKAKEFAAQERVALSAAFSANSFSPGAFRRLTQIVAAQEDYVSVFSSLATEDQVDFLRQKMNSSSVDEVKKMREIAFEKSAAGSFGVKPDEWYDQITRKVDLYKEVEDKVGADLNQRSDSVQNAAETALYAFFALTLGLILVSALLTMRSVTSIANLLRYASETIFRSSVKVASGSKQIASAGQQLAEGVSEQASSIEETSSSLEELTSMTKQNAENAVQARGLSENARVAADEGNRVMGEMNLAMGEIKAASDQIGKIIKTIDEIAFQTNLLALNAAVEAARAGAAGKGFAVVAEEVRNLAQRSAAAAKESGGMIETAVLKANAGVETAKKVAANLVTIGANINKTNELLSEIAAGSQEQSQGIGQVNAGVQQIDKVVQANAANAEQSAAAAEEMSAQSIALMESVSELAQLVGVHSEMQEEQIPRSRLGHTVADRTQEARRNGRTHSKTAGSNGKGSTIPKRAVMLNDRMIPLNEDTAVKQRDFERL